MERIRFLSVLSLATLLVACTGPSPTTSRDGYPPRDIDVSNIPDAVPKYEPIRAAGNKSPYSVLGRTYRVLPSNEGYRERGLASWYGTKFHGQKTSNGETYDMFAMTGAHKSLPIPSYARVTNLKNRRSVIVRINDRGPFHDDRLIDLSYAAAKKLGYSDKGTADVEVEAIVPHRYQANPVESPHIDESPIAGNRNLESLPNNAYLQAGAFRSRQSAEELRQRIAQVSHYPSQVKQNDDSGNILFKVLIGPIADDLEIIKLRNMLEQTIHLKSFLIYDRP